MNEVKIVNYNPEWENIYKKYKKKILKTEKRVYHVGSASAKIKGRKEIDILLISDDIPKTYETMAKMGFTKGPIEEYEAHMRNRYYGVRCDLHIFKPNHKQVKTYLEQSKKLQNNPEIREKYIKLKEECDGVSIEEYRKKKKEFWKNIRKI